MEFLRRCPSCGRRFSVKLERKELVEREHDTIRVLHDAVTYPTRLGGVVPVAALAEEVPIGRDIIKVTYDCRRCHHQWSEKVPVVKKEGRGGETTGVRPA